MDNWVCTDSDNGQFCKKISDDVFMFKQKHNEGYIEDTIYLYDYSEEEIKDFISPYYRSINEIKKIYGKSAKAIIAECIFEQENILY